MTENVNLELELAFKNDCRIINLKYEYPHYQGTQRWAIATDLSEMELRAKYSAQISAYEPFLLLTMEQALVIVKFHSNNRKHEIRNATHGDAFAYEDGETEKYHSELIEDPFDDGPDMSYLYRAIDRLAPTQQERIKKYFLLGFTCVDIAAEEGVSIQAIQQSIARSLKTLKKILETVDSDPS